MPRILLFLTALGFALHPAPAVGGPPADTLYANGIVVTMDDAQPIAEAVAVRDGRILAVGPRKSVSVHAGETTRVVDLGGKTLLPGFVDSHGHAYMIGLQATTANLLPPPDGGVENVEDLVEALQDWKAHHSQAIETVGWIVGFGYDDAQLDRYPTRHDLDRVSEDVPILIIHQSGHLGVANSKALEVADVNADTPDPEGGVYRREPGSREPNGICEEYAFFHVMGQLTQSFDDSTNDLLVAEGTRLLASYGYTTAQEGRGIPSGLEALERVARRGGLAIDIVAYPDILMEANAPFIHPSLEYEGRYRVGGVKLTIDGSPQGKTAWLTRPYHVAPEGHSDAYTGYAAIDEQTTFDAIDKAFANGWQVICHANGDAAADRLIAAVRRAQRNHPGVDTRPVLIHGQVLRRDQVQALDELGIFPSLFPMHTYYWGDWHRDSVLGPERAENISPTGWVLERGMRFASHHDAPVALPDSMRVLSATVTRRTRSGDILGPGHRVPVDTALRALTLWPAWQHFEEDHKGSIEVGKLADFVVLSANPLEAADHELAGLKVLKTIKEDSVIYERPAEMALTSPAPFGVAPRAPHTQAHRHTETAHGDGCFNPALDLLVDAYDPSSR